MGVGWEKATVPRVCHLWHSLRPALGSVACPVHIFGGENRPRRVHRILHGLVHCMLPVGVLVVSVGAHSRGDHSYISNSTVK